MPTPSTHESKLARLDRPQRLGFLPTEAFWERRDVKKAARPLIVGFAFQWFMMIDLFAPGLPVWANSALSVAGLYLFVALLERYIRARLRARARLLPADPVTDDGGAKPATQVARERSV